MNTGAHPRPEAQIDPDALRHNWSLFAASGQTAAVVKADAYGLGVGRIVPILVAAGCRRWYVATALEALAVRRLTGAGHRISVLNGPCRTTMGLYCDHALTPVLNSPEQIALWRQSGPEEIAPAIHVDTGINRLGLEQRHWTEARTAVPRPSLLMSHLACARTPNHEMNAIQLARFATARTLFSGVAASFANSAGAVLGPEFRCDEIRVGIGLYGVGPQTRPAVRLTAPILQLRRLHAGRSTGYDHAFTAGTDMDIACIGAGYADGVLQSRSGAGYALVHSERRPLVGRVSMDSAMMDVHGLTSPARVGENVELFGPSLPIGDQAQALGVSDYMLLTALGPRVARVVNPSAAP